MPGRGQRLMSSWMPFGVIFARCTFHVHASSSSPFSLSSSTLMSSFLNFSLRASLRLSALSPPPASSAEIVFFANAVSTAAIVSTRARSRPGS